ncbi:AAA family ATPase [Nocardiopsis sp. NPDC050513]|uniref:MinD/ParA family ATP-binding protein n=1 Tax=Nocardiopsis sp. NPDC050513 TaxID=3364338 RepID=UPI0037BA7C27
MALVLSRAVTGAGPNRTTGEAGALAPILDAAQDEHDEAEGMAVRVDHKQVPSFPKITATVFHDEAAEVIVNGVSTSVTGRDLPETRTNIIRHIAQTAEKLGRPVRALTVDDQDEWSLVVYPDGLVENDSTAEPGKRQGRKRSAAQGRRGSQGKIRDTRSRGDRPEQQAASTEREGAGASEAAAAPGTQPIPEPSSTPGGDTGAAPMERPPFPPPPASPVTSDPQPDAGLDEGRSERPTEDGRPRVSASSVLFRAVRRRLEERERDDQRARESTSGTSEWAPPAQGPSAPPAPLSKSESENLWASVIEEINQERGAAPAPPPPVGYGPANQGYGTGSGVTGVFERRAGAPVPVPPVSAAPIPVVGSHTRIAVLSLKGGVGKTTTTVLLGSVFASASENRAIAVDMNPHSGTLRDRVPLQNPHTLRDLYENAGRITRYSDLRRYVSINGARMHALVGDPEQSTGLLDERGAYKKAADVLEQYYDITLTDCGTGLGNPGMNHVLQLADRVVIVLEPALDAARAAVTTLEWLSRNGYERLGSTALAAVSRVDPRVVGPEELAGLERFFHGRVAGVVRVPFDEHLARGGIVHLGDLREETRAASHRLAALSLGA